MYIPLWFTIKHVGKVVKKILMYKGIIRVPKTVW